MLSSRWLSGLAALSFPVILGAACTEQFDRSKMNNVYTNERVTTEKALPVLTAAGELPSGAVAAVPIGEKYKMYCGSCHGDAGDGNGPAGAALTPKPRNFHDAAWQTATDDARITSVIKNGGAANGLSATMAPWGGVLADDEIKEMVAHIRKWKT